MKEFKYNDVKYTRLSHDEIACFQCNIVINDFFTFHNCNTTLCRVKWSEILEERFLSNTVFQIEKSH